MPAATRHNVGSLEEFPVGTRTIVDLDGRAVGVFNVDGALYAVLDVCPHELTPICGHGAVSGTTLPSTPGVIEYGMEGRVLRCPWHGYEFDLTTGRALFTNFRGRLRTFPVEVEDGIVVVETGRRVAAVATGGG